MFSTGLPSRSSPRLHPRAPGFASAKASARQSSLSSATRAKTGGKEITLPLVQPKCAYRADFYLHACGFGGKGIRTPGLLIANETLYQLSYTPGRRSENITTSRFVSNRNHNRARHFASCPFHGCLLRHRLRRAKRGRVSPSPPLAANDCKKRTCIYASKS
jgi:hypothetical protein